MAANTTTEPHLTKKSSWLPLQITVAGSLFILGCLVGPPIDYFSAKRLDEDLGANRACITDRARALGQVDAEVFTSSVEAGIREAKATPSLKYSPDRYLPRVKEYAAVQALPKLVAEPTMSQFEAHQKSLRLLTSDGHLNRCVAGLRSNIYFEEHRDTFTSKPPLLMLPYIRAFGPL